MEREICHCWYSKSQEHAEGYIIYNIDGADQKVTNVSSVGITTDFNRADSVYLGLGYFVEASPKRLEYARKVFGPVRGVDWATINEVEACVKIREVIANIERSKEAHVEN